MKKIVFLLFFALIVCLSAKTQAFALTAAPEILGETAILIDVTTGDILYEKDKDGLREPASTTKIITCLLALERLSLDQVVTVDAESPFTDGSRIYIIEGEELTVEQLLHALMLASANDTAAALAREISGSVEEFADLMNERARELGAKQPSYRNPHGLHQQGHFASAYDLAMVAREAMKNPEFRKLVSTYMYTITATNKQPEERYLYNTNRLIYDEVNKVPVKGVMTTAKYDGANGIKTGYTPQAGGTLVASAKRDGTELIAVVMKSTDEGRFGDCIALLDYGFENFYTYKAVDSNTPVDDVRTERGAFNYVGAKILRDMYITLPRAASLSLISTKIVIDENITAPISEGQILGRAEVYEGGGLIGEVPVVATADLAEGMFLSRFGIEDSVSEKIMRYLKIAACALGFIIAVFIFLKIRYSVKRRARRRRRAFEIAFERDRKQKELEQRRWPY